MTIFRVDFGSEMGMGHLMRSLVYAKRFDEVIFVSKSDKKEFVPYKLVTIESEENFFDQVEKLHPTQVIIDNYNFTLEDEKEFKKRFPHVKLSVFDDDYREHFCDEIINHNISADKSKYPKPDIVSIIPPLIRDEFYKEKTIKREKIYDIFIAMGGSDTANLNIPILKALPKSFKIALVTTSANAHLQKLKDYVRDKTNITLYIDSQELAKVMNQSELAIVTPSVVVHEVMFMGLPFVAVQTADNQKEIVKYLQKYRYPVLKAFEKKLLIHEIYTLLARKLELINFSNLDTDEKKMILEWRNDPKIRKWMRTKKPITLKEHLNFIDSLKSRTDKRYFVAKEREKYIGVIDFTDVNPKEKSAFFGLYTNPSLKKSGTGSKLLARIIDYAKKDLDLKLLRLEVLSSNKKAIALYEKFGFLKYGQENEYLYMELQL